MDDICRKRARRRRRDADDPECMRKILRLRMVVAAPHLPLTLEMLYHVDTPHIRQDLDGAPLESNQACFDLSVSNRVGDPLHRPNPRRGRLAGMNSTLDFFQRPVCTVAYGRNEIIRRPFWRRAIAD